jgi:iron complex outermembrane receptor protein
MKGLKSRHGLAGTSALALLFGGVSAFAQPTSVAPTKGQDRSVTTIADIVVTAQRREQRLQDVPVAVTAITEGALTVNRVTNIRDLDTIAPGLLVKPVVGGAQLPSYTLRGIFTLGNTVGADKGVGVYIDGVYMGAAQGAISNLADIERIEVLRGPQGTLFGRNSTGGAISFITREPTGVLGGKQTITLGNYDQFRSVTSLSSPQMGPFSAFLTYMHSQRRGDVRNLGAGTRWDVSRVSGRTETLTSPKYMGDENSESLLGSIKGEFGDLKVVYRGDWAEDDYTAPAYGLIYLAPPTRGVYAAQPNQSILTPVSPTRPKAVNDAGTTPGHGSSWGHSLTATLQVNEQISIKNIAAIRDAKVNTGLQDITGFGGAVVPVDAAARAFIATIASPRPVVGTAGVGTPIIWNSTSAVNDTKQWSEELQVNVDTHWATLIIGGLYYKQETKFGYLGAENGIGLLRNGGIKYVPDFAFASGIQPEIGGRYSRVTQLSKAAYAHAEGHLTRNFDIVGGVRYTHDRKSGTDNTAYSAANPVSLPINYSKGQVTFDAGVNYKPTSDVLLYTKYSTGYISGGQLAGVDYAPEKAKSWEGGVKADWLDHKLRTNLALFSVKYDGIQFGASPRNVPLYSYLIPLGVTQILVNAGSARAKGFELETTLTPTRSLMLQANVSYLDFKYLVLSPAISTGTAEVPPQGRPKWTSQLAAQYTSDPVFKEAYVSFRIDGNYKSKQFLGISLPLAQTTNTGLLTGNFASIYTPAEGDALKRALTANAYWLVNARLALENIDVGGKKASVALWARNLFNNKSLLYGNSLISLGHGNYEPARTFGVDATVKF